MKEIWKDIEDYPGYMVSNFGNVRNKNGKVLKIQNHPLGYACISLSFNGIYRTELIHRLVAKAFLDNPDGYKEINHKDEDKKNNHVDNIEWCTRSHNMRWGMVQERIKKTKIESHRHLTEEHKEKIRQGQIRRWEKFHQSHPRIS